MKFQTRIKFYSRNRWYRCIPNRNIPMDCSYQSVWSIDSRHALSIISGRLRSVAPPIGPLAFDTSNSCSPSWHSFSNLPHVFTCHVYFRQHLFLFSKFNPLLSLPRSACRERSLMAPRNSWRIRVYILLLLATKQLQHRSVIWIMLQKFSSSKRLKYRMARFRFKMQYTGNLNDSSRTVVI